MSGLSPSAEASRATTVGAIPGLRHEEAARLLSSIGPNEVVAHGRRSIPRICLETIREPMFLLLISAAALYLALGDLGEGLFLVGGAVAAIGLVIVQEARSERALAALRELAQPNARVIRDGSEREIPARELVPGDILLIGEGERAPADGVLVAGDALRVDESALTGESAPVSKVATDLATARDANEVTPGAESGPFLFAGTLVVRGQGVIEVTRTGERSALGRIGKSLAEIAHELTPLQKTAGRLVGILGGVAIGFCALVAIAYGLLRDDWIGGALAGLTIAISLVPEEYPLVLAIFFAIGAWRLATHKVLTRRSSSIETLGSATVLCVDKTGTLTENRMAIARLWTREGDFAVSGESEIAPSARTALRIAALASAVRPVDPMDKAVHAMSRVAMADDPLLRAEPEQAWPLRPELLAVIQVWRTTGESRVVAAKGAPEAIFRLCRLDPAEVARLHDVIEAYAAQGLRVLGVASAQHDGPLGREPQAFPFQFAGLVGFIDPLRADVPAALEEARRAGIGVIMITGDHPATAMAISRAAGLDVSAGVLLGAEVAALPFEALCQRLKTVRVFARIVPEQKLRIVEALKADGEIVAMTGDGVNDAPALQAAHIGVAMGKRGTDVAREAADLVLLDDSFASIVGGVRLGRRIFANLRRALTYITAIHVPIAGLALLPILLGLPPILFPMHVVLLELIIDPTCSLVFESEPAEADAMRQPPRPASETLFGPSHIGVAVLQGMGVLIGVLGLYWWSLTMAGTPEPQARGAALVALVIANLVLALADAAVPGRLFTDRRYTYWAIVGVVALVLALVLAVPAVGSIFKIAMPGAGLLGLAAGIGLVAGGVWRSWAFVRSAVGR
jgi:Ca2+-transporting ATPase